MLETDCANPPEEPCAESNGHSGKLSYEHQVADVLKEISREPIQSEILLNLRSPSGLVNGYLIIKECRFIVGASCNENKIQGSEAARKLLMLTVGEYSWTVLRDDAVCEAEPNLYLNLQAIIPKLPFLPDNLNSCFDETSLLDKIFMPDKWVAMFHPSRLLDFFFEPEPAKQAGRGIKLFRRSAAATLTSLRPIISPDKGRDSVIRVPRLLRERLFRGSLANTIERHFSTVSSVNIKRLQKRHASFKHSRSSKSLVPIYASIAIISFLVLSGVIFFLDMFKSNNRLVVQKNYKMIPRDNSSHRVLRHSRMRS